MEFNSLFDLVKCFTSLGAEHIYCKFLAENDNTKQQIYLGGSFEVLKLLRYGEIRAESGGRRPNFKAPLTLDWVSATGLSAPAPGAQLILYPDYPEVRLSGFLRGCPLAPSIYLQPIPAIDRQCNNGPDGRVLFFGVTPDKVLTALATTGSSLALETKQGNFRSALFQSDVLREIPLTSAKNTKELLFNKLREIIYADNPWHPSMRLDKNGVLRAYKAKNGGGYTLEALFDIIPNGRSAPDYMGWEIKAYSSSRVTLMTPEPNAGFYGEYGVEAFLRRYGRHVGEDTLYFTGAHYANEVCITTGKKLEITGFNAVTGKIIDVEGGVKLIDAHGTTSAEWSFSGLIEHWGRKHAAAIYVPYIKSSNSPPEFRYENPVLVGEGTDFELFLRALAAKHIVYDPGPKLENASTLNSKTKARSQFRINTKNLKEIYYKFEHCIL
jgi:hypothetical protein